ncbi:MAG: hypothetical protein ACRCX2_34000 [Paraclostridium sp.]
MTEYQKKKLEIKQNKNKRLMGLLLVIAGYMILYCINDIRVFSIEFLVTLVSTLMISLGFMMRY